MSPFETQGGGPGPGTREGAARHSPRGWESHYLAEAVRDRQGRWHQGLSPLPPAPPRRAACFPSLCPLSAARASPAVDEQLFRSVEGQAASDEEDDSEKWQQELGPPAEVKALLAGLSSCGRGCVCR